MAMIAPQAPIFHGGAPPCPATEAARRAVEQMHWNSAAGRGAGATLGIREFDVPRRGFALAVKGFERIIEAGTGLEAEVAKYVVDHQDLLAGSAQRYLGLWEHGGNVHLDVVEVWHALRVALRVARARGEFAVYDLFGGNEIPVVRLPPGTEVTASGAVAEPRDLGVDELGPQARRAD